MTSYRSVDDTLVQLDELNGSAVQVEGILTTLSNGSVHGYELAHYPRAERQIAHNGGLSYKSGLWLEFGAGSIQPNRSVLTRWVGKRVRVHGVAHRAKYLEASGEPQAMSDPSCWQAHLEVYSVQRVTSEQRGQHRA